MAAAPIVPFVRDDFDRLAAEIRWHEAQATAQLVGALEHYAEAGGRLRLARKGLPHGEWLPWVEREFAWTDRYARRLMEWSRLVAANRNCSSDLPPGSVSPRAIAFFKAKGEALARADVPDGAHPFDLPRDDYRIVLADPPWQYDSWTAKGKGRVADDHYPTMTLDAIKALPVAGVCAPDALLLCWVTLPLLREGLEVVEAWGFTYRTAFLVWGKLTGDRTPAVGFGRYTRSNGELCLLAKRGNGVRPVAGVAIPNLLLSERGRHSEKPLAQYDVIDRLFGQALPRVELFARRRMPGWDVWGLEAPEGVSALDLRDTEVFG